MLDARSKITLAAAAATGCLVLVLGGCGQPAQSSTATAAQLPRAAASLRVTPAATRAADTGLVTVPDVTGRVYAASAQMAVASAGLLTAYRMQHSPTVAAGLVITQTPAGNARVPAGTTVTLVVSTGPVSIAGAQPCQAAHLKLQPGPRVSEATGQHTLDWSFTNLGAPCVLNGYPAVSALDSGGRLLGYTYTHAGDQMTTGAAPLPVYLPAGSAAWIRVNKYRCDVGVSDTATMLQVSLPAAGGTVDVPVSLDYCAEAASLTLAVSPFEPVEILLSPGN